MVDGKIKWRVLGISLFLTVPLRAIDPPKGILLTRPAPGTPDSKATVVEFQSIEEQLVPLTDFITVYKMEGSPDRVLKDLVIRRIEYPDPETLASIVNDARANGIAGKISELQKVTAQYPQTRQILNPKIAGWQKEVDWYKQGYRKKNGKWMTGQDYTRLVTEENLRLMAQEAARQARIQADRERAEAEAAEAKRKAEEIEQMRRAAASPPSIIQQTVRQFNLPQVVHRKIQSPAQPPTLAESFGIRGLILLAGVALPGFFLLMVKRVHKQQERRNPSRPAPGVEGSPSPP